MKKMIPLFSLLIFLFMSCNSTTQNQNHKIVDVNVEVFKAKMNDSNTVILDVRTPAETAKGKIEDAIEIDINASGFNKKIQSLDKNKTYLVYCRSGKRSKKACGILEDNGFESLYNLEGGCLEWKSK